MLAQDEKLSHSQMEQYSYSNTEQQYTRHRTKVGFKISGGTGTGGLVVHLPCIALWSVVWLYLATANAGLVTDKSKSTQSLA